MILFTFDIIHIYLLLGNYFYDSMPRKKQQNKKKMNHLCLFVLYLISPLNNFFRLFCIHNCQPYGCVCFHIYRRRNLYNQYHFWTRNKLEKTLNPVRFLREKIEKRKYILYYFLTNWNRRDFSLSGWNLSVTTDRHASFLPSRYLESKFLFIYFFLFI